MGAWSRASVRSSACRATCRSYGSGGGEDVVDLPQGGWYGKASAEDVIAKVTQAAREVHRRYGHHAAFYGWYLNYEINPIRPDDVEETAYWRQVWKAIADQCHRLAPGSMVTSTWPESGPSEARKNTRPPGIASTLRNDECAARKAADHIRASSALT